MRKIRTQKIRRRWEPRYICNWMSFTRPFLLGTVFLRTALPCSGGYYMERGVMPLHDIVGINCKNGATTKNQGSCVRYICTKGCILMAVCVLSDLTWLPLLGGGRKSWHIIGRHCDTKQIAQAVKNSYTLNYGTLSMNFQSCNLVKDCESDAHAEVSVKQNRYETYQIVRWSTNWWILSNSDQEYHQTSTTLIWHTSHYYFIMVHESWPSSHLKSLSEFCSMLLSLC